MFRSCTRHQRANWRGVVSVATLAVCVLLVARGDASGRELLAQISPTAAAGPDDPTCSMEGPGGLIIAIEAVARIESSHGTVRIQAAGKNVFRPGPLDALICPDEALLTGEKSRAAIMLLERETVLRVDENTKLVLATPPEAGHSVLELLNGALHFLSRIERTLDIRTPFVNAGVEGTEAYVSVDDELSGTFVAVFEGTVTATAGLLPSPFARDQVRLTSGQTLLGQLDREFTVATPDNVPTRYRPLVVNPRNAVRWAIYYPPVLLGPPGVGPASLREASALLNAGRFEEAEAVLATVPDAPGITGNKLALRTIIAVAQNRVDDALDLGRRAVAASPRSAAAKIALSYAEQADFELEAARDLLLAAVEDEPENPLAWARLAELWLSLGYARRSRDAASRATALADIGLTNTILGFAELASFDPAAAQSQFERALTLDDQNPLTRLGLGLARIRQGELAEGRQEIEIAASLDPLDSIVRSYLGKAYFEERRGEPAGLQFSQAKDLDEADPTPWFYDAILKQSENRPVEALEDLQRSIALNDNRAVHRSRLLLDEDLAARQTALARIYDTLGFDQLAVVEGARSLSLDPANDAAHRFLSDSNAARPRHEIARASELLQAQLLQPININPIQPSLKETDLNILERIGPDRLGVNEFTSLFERDRLSFDATGLVGNNETWSNEAVMSGIHGRMSWSAGQFHYESDGFRENNGIEHDIYNVFVQAALSDGFDVQVELRRRETDRGDVRLNFDPNDFSTIDRFEFEQDSVRLGLHLNPWPHSDILGSFIYADADTNEVVEEAPGSVAEFDSMVDGYDAQAQYLFSSRPLNVIAGVGASEFDNDETLQFTSPFPFCCVDLSGTSEQNNAYIYSNLSFSDSIIWTAGISYDSHKREPVDVDRFNPKAGLQFHITDDLLLRLAYFRTLKRELVANQTLEPTQIAGFNQFFDDIDATRSERYGIGLDATFTRNLFGGFEFSHRRLTIPTISGASVLNQEQDEDLYRGYLYWTPHARWALTAEATWEGLDNDPDIAAGSGRPEQINTLTVPVVAQYFGANGFSEGFFAKLGGTYVHQEVDFSPSITPRSDSEEFVIVDAVAGYRLPNRRGLVSLEVRNLLDEDFRFQDLNTQPGVEPVNPRYIPDLTFMVQVTLNF